MPSTRPLASVKVVFPNLSLYIGWVFCEMSIDDTTSFFLVRNKVSTFKDLTGFLRLARFIGTWLLSPGHIICHNITSACEINQNFINFNKICVASKIEKELQITVEISVFSFQKQKNFFSLSDAISIFLISQFKRRDRNSEL